jgi:hypothetical protein
MKKKGFTAEQVTGKLGGAEVLVKQGRMNILNRSTGS